MNRDLINLSSLYRRIRSLMAKQELRQWEDRINALIREDTKLQHKIDIAIMELSERWREISPHYDDGDSISLSEALEQ